jgi:hypothetical protein
MLLRPPVALGPNSEPVRVVTVTTHQRAVHQQWQWQCITMFLAFVLLLHFPCSSATAHLPSMSAEGNTPRVKTGEASARVDSKTTCFEGSN